MSGNPVTQTIVAEDTSTGIAGFDQTVGVKKYQIARFEGGQESFHRMGFPATSQGVGGATEEDDLPGAPASEQGKGMPSRNQRHFMGLGIENPAAECEKMATTAQFLQHPVDALSQQQGIEG